MHAPIIPAPVCDIQPQGASVVGTIHILESDLEKEAGGERDHGCYWFKVDGVKRKRYKLENPQDVFVQTGPTWYYSGKSHSSVRNHYTLMVYIEKPKDCWGNELDSVAAICEVCP